MPLDLAKVGVAVQKGLSVVCASCSLYWEARDKGVPEPKCMAKDGCGSPLKGDDFHEYSGPITDFSRWCFVCGADALHGVRAREQQRVVGVCTDHLRMLHELEPSDELTQHVVREVRNGKQTVPLERLFRRSGKKTLAQVLFEVDTYYSKRASGG